MDQDSFRQLLQSSGSAQKSATNGTGWNAGKNVKPKKTEPAKPAFKPRKVKKPADDYRDRAAERRTGVAHDFAEVEALAEDFERRHADQDRAEVEEQRQYLGGDSEHTVLVKGLDFALLEQNKARAAAATEDDDVLEQAFTEAVLPKKRTREDIVKELRNKRQKSEGAPEDTTSQVVDDPLENAKKAGKFKPIGFKPIGSTEAKKKKKVKVKKVEAGTKKKVAGKDKPVGDAPAAPSPKDASTSTSIPPPPAPPQPQPDPEPLDEDFDIFAGAGEYTGVDLGDDDDGSDGELDGAADGPSRTAAREEEEAAAAATARGRWFATDEPEQAPRPATPPAKSHSPPPTGGAPEEREEGEEAEEAAEAPVRLAPLVSSSIPSIREFLAMDLENEKQEKRRARKEKKKGKAKMADDDE